MPTRDREVRRSYAHADVRAPSRPSVVALRKVAVSLKPPKKLTFYKACVSIIIIGRVSKSKAAKLPANDSKVSTDG